MGKKLTLQEIKDIFYDNNLKFNRKWKFVKAEFRYKKSWIVFFICDKGHKSKKRYIEFKKDIGCGLCGLRGHNNQTKVIFEKSFKYLFPDKAKQWDYEKNKKSKPEDFFPYSNKKFNWKCEKGHKWKAAIADLSRATGNGCNKCTNQTSKPEIRILTELKFIFSEIKSRFKILGQEVDIFIPENKICIEFDGSHWHKNKEEKDKQKNKILKDYFIIRVREFPLKKIMETDIVVPQRDLVKSDINKILRIIQNYTSNEFRPKIDEYLKDKFFKNEKLFKKYLTYFPSPLPSNSLQFTHTKLSKEWDYELNHPLTPNNFTRGSHFKAWWKCINNKKHPSFIQIIKSRTNRRDGCPYCSKQKIIYEDSFAFNFPELLKEWDYHKNKKITPETISPDSGRVIHWICPLKGCKYSKVLRHRTRKKQNCKICFGYGI